MTNLSQATLKDCEPPAKRPSWDKPRDSLEPASLRDPEVEVPLSNQTHVLGFSVHAKFVAYALASTPDVPVRMLVHHHKAQTCWGEENRELSLYDGEGRFISSAAIPCPEGIMGPLRPRQSPKDADFFDNIIIDTRGAAILPSLTALRHRIDRRTTICLLHPGLGLVEQLIEQVFDDPLQRPNFVLGHSTHKLSRVRDIMFSMKQRKPGALYLYGVPKFEGSTLDKSSLVYEGMRQSQHLVQLLSSTECLNVVGLPWARFLSWKLPTLIFTSLADTISVALGCKYQEIYHNHHARIMWDSLLEETLAIISQFPELQDVPHRIHYFTAHSFRRKLQMYLAAQRANTSPWIKQVKMGNNVPVDYFNGYFVQRARELGLTHEYNSMAVEIVKARVSARQTELRSDLRFRVPYMTDTDLIGGGQPIPSLEDTLELELEGF